MTVETITIIISMSIILIGLLVKDFIISAIRLKLSEKPCDIVVKSKKTGRKYHASTYRISPTKGMEIKIYNPYLGGFEWYSIWRFYNPRHNMRKIDFDYYSQENSKYRGSEYNSNFTDGDYI